MPKASSCSPTPKVRRRLFLVLALHQFLRNYWSSLEPRRGVPWESSSITIAPIAQSVLATLTATADLKSWHYTLGYRGYDLDVVREVSLWQVGIHPRKPELPIVHRCEVRSHNQEEAVLEAKRRVDAILRYRKVAVRRVD